MQVIGWIIPNRVYCFHRMIYKAWCWFCWKLTGKWWPFGSGKIAFPIYLWFLPWAGEYIYWDHDYETGAGAIGELGAKE